MGRQVSRAGIHDSTSSARLTGLALVAWRPALLAPLLREAARTPSPNGGWPMGAMALRLGRVLSKPGHYRLNPSGGDVIAEDMLTAHRLAAGAMLGLAALLALGAAALRGGFAVVRSTL